MTDPGGAIRGAGVSVNGRLTAALAGSYPPVQGQEPTIGRQLHFCTHNSCARTGNGVGPLMVHMLASGRSADLHGQEAV
jgi:hypothetical protein